MSRRTERMKDEGERMKEDKKSESGSDSSFILHPLSFPLRILVAEDNEFNAQLLEQLLARRGHRVRLAKNGREALSLLGIGHQESGVRSQGSGTSSPPTPDSCPLRPDVDLLLLDVHMPELDGFRVI